MGNIATIAAIVAAVIGTAGLGGILKILFSRIGKLEKSLETERDRCDREMRILRHRERNQRTLIFSLLHLFDLPATRRKPLLAIFREKLAAIEQAEALEVGMAIAGISVKPGAHTEKEEEEAMS